MTATFATPLRMLYQIPGEITEDSNILATGLLWILCFVALMCRSTLTNVFSSGSHGSPQLSHELLGIESDFDDVVEQSEERSQWEGRHKQRDKPKLDDCWSATQRDIYHRSCSLSERDRVDCCTLSFAGSIHPRTVIIM